MPRMRRSEALRVHNTWPHIIVLALLDEHALEAGELGQDGRAHPDEVSSLRARRHLHIDLLRRQGLDLLGEALCDAREHGVAATQHNVLEEISPHIDIASLDAGPRGLMYARQLTTAEHRVEEHLGHPESLRGEGHLVPIWHLINLLVVRGLRPHFLHELFHFALAHVAHGLLHVAHDLPLRRGGHHVTALGQDLDHVLGEIPPSQVQPLDGVGQRKPLIHRNHVRDTVAAVHNASRGAAVRVQRHDCLDDHEASWTAELLEQHLHHPLAVLLGVHRSLADDHGVLLGVHAQGVVKGVMPHLLHISPVFHDAMLNRVGQRKDTFLGDGFLAHVVVPLLAAWHHHVMLRSADQCGEDARGRLHAGHPSLHVT
mmetsp:Transcript_100753/g.260315  ORF Transcript_100753/g.260315 Transcript_100753/m.260315 type:complete len:371 (-) Transcript_100753:139-1251(-)